jgi:hypothetical protein
MPGLWSRPDDPNLATALAGYVGSGAPLVAGFELAGIVLLLTTEKLQQHIPLAGPATVAMVASVMVLLFSIRYGFWAVSYWTTPDERMMWNPAAMVDDDQLRFERFLLAQRLALFRKLKDRSEHLFQLGIAIFMLGIVLILVPHRVAISFVTWRWAAMWLAVAALAVHLFWTAGAWAHDRLDDGYERLRAKLPPSAEQDTAEAAATEAAAATPDPDPAHPGPKPLSPVAARWIRRRMTAVRAADRALLVFLGVIWPTAKPPRVSRPGEASAVDIAGLRHDLPPAPGATGSRGQLGRAGDRGATT